MMRLCVYSLGILLIAVAQPAFAQAQIDNSANKKQPSAHVDSVYDPDRAAPQSPDKAPRALSTGWLQARADDLKDVLSCYFPMEALDKLIAQQESDSKGDPASLIKVRIKQLKTLAVNHAEAQYCE